MILIITNGYILIINNDFSQSSTGFPFNIWAIIHGNVVSNGTVPLSIQLSPISATLSILMSLSKYTHRSHQKIDFRRINQVGTPDQLDISAQSQNWLFSKNQNLGTIETYAKDEKFQKPQKSFMNRLWLKWLDLVFENSRCIDV